MLVEQDRVYCGKKWKPVFHVCFNVLGKEEVGSLLYVTLPDLESMVELSMASIDREIQFAPRMQRGVPLLVLLLQPTPTVHKSPLSQHLNGLCESVLLEAVLVKHHLPLGK